MKKLPRNQFIQRATAGYAVLALVWIFLSDKLLLAFTDVDSLVRLSTAKGVLFVVVTTALFFFALQAVPSDATAERHAVFELLASSLLPERYPRWMVYLFAGIVSLVMLWVLTWIVAPLGDRQLLVLLMFPIILSALMGGLGPGLLATLIAVFGASYLVIPPLQSFLIASSHDLIQWCFLLVNGTAVSLLSELLQRSLKSAELNRRLLETVVSGSSNAVFVKDLQGHYLLANQATAGFLGRQVSEVVGHDDGDLFPEDTAQKLMAIDRGIMDRGEIQTHEEFLTMPDGRELVFQVTKGPVLDNRGRVIGLFGIAHDTTENRQAAEEIRRLNATLEKRVEERTAELRAANRELESQSYAIAHNLRAPLRAMDGFSQALLDDFSAEIHDGMRNYLDQIQLGARQMGKLIDALLALSRSTHAELQREQVAVSTLAEMVRKELSQQEPWRRVLWQIEPNLSVWGDVSLLGVVLRNLLGNAWKFTALTDAGLIRVYADELHGMRRICISDNGIGFDMRHSAMLFQPFQRLHRQDEFSGIGIGLALVQRIIQRHGGTVQATAAPGSGAVFCFALPDPLQQEDVVQLT